MTVIGITDRGLDGLTADIRARINDAAVLVGGQRHLQKVEASQALRIDWTGGLDAAIDRIAEQAGKHVVILASGDPLHYGIGARLVDRFGAAAIRFLPAPGAFSLAAARMGWSLPDVTCLTVHGRPLDCVNLHLHPNARLLLLSWDGGTAKAVADLLCARGFGDSRISVLEHMEGDRENRLDGVARDWPQAPTANLNTLAVTCIAGADAVFWSRAPGLPEAAYQHDGKITKREVRAATIAALAPLPGETLWDVGAGSGAVGIEWMRMDVANRALAFEQAAANCATIKFNAANLGVPGLEIIAGDAAVTLPDRVPSPDAIFIGGGVSNRQIMNLCWDRLRAGGRLVANGVTLEAHGQLLDFQSSHGGDLVRIAVARSGNVGRMTALRPLMDVLQLKVSKT